MKPKETPLILDGAWITPNLHICWDPRPTLTGWAQPKSWSGGGPRKAHYFHGSQSLCRKWIEYDGLVLDEQPENVCVTCLRKVKHRGWA